jgi:hypothetical protein
MTDNGRFSTTRRFTPIGPWILGPAGSEAFPPLIVVNAEETSVSYSPARRCETARSYAHGGEEGTVGTQRR